MLFAFKGQSYNSLVNFSSYNIKCNSLPVSSPHIKSLYYLITFSIKNINQKHNLPTSRSHTPSPRLMHSQPRAEFLSSLNTRAYMRLSRVSRLGSPMCDDRWPAMISSHASLFELHLFINLCVLSVFINPRVHYCSDLTWDFPSHCRSLLFELCNCIDAPRYRACGERALREASWKKVGHVEKGY